MRVQHRLVEEDQLGQSRTQISVAVLHQEMPSIDHEGVVKAPKPGGYRDSGADIVFALQQTDVRVVTPLPVPNPALDSGWTFPDTEDGIASAILAGANTLWANTVLYKGHPLEQVLGDVEIVGQLPNMVDKYDDKAFTNEELYEAGLPVARHLIVAESYDFGSDLATSELNPSTLASHNFEFPLVVKPVRGRGSAGVTLVENIRDLRQIVEVTISSRQFGRALLIEPYLPGEEVTITVMPPDPTGRGCSSGHWCLPPVRRSNHHQGIAPYNGLVPVVHNSKVLSESERREVEVLDILKACRAVGEHIDARAPIRVDCRKDSEGVFLIFDVNLKPNMTGPGRPGRRDQLSLTGIAAGAEGMNYRDLVLKMLEGAWR